MTWTYTNAPDTTTDAGRRDAVRMLIGDIDTTDQQITDESITFWLDQEGDDIYGAAIRCVRQLIALYARQVDTWMGHTRVDGGKRMENYQALLYELESRRNVGLEVFAGGLTISGKDTLNADADAVQPSFSRGQDDYTESEATLRGDLD